MNSFVYYLEYVTKTPPRSDFKKNLFNIQLFIIVRLVIFNLFVYKSRLLYALWATLIL